jgi:hypothetical protein
VAVKPAVALAALTIVVAAAPATAQDATRVAMGRVRLTTDPKIPIGCATLGTVDDTSLKDLRRKIVRLGGDTGLLSFPAENLERVNAIVFRCPPPPPPPVSPPPPPPPGSAPVPPR